MSIESTHLGKTSSYPTHYEPTVLVAVPRDVNRIQYGIENEALPFTGIDIWHAYEFSFLLNSGLPVAGILKITYPAESESIVESKSLKLYLNSFNMDKFGNIPEDGVKEVLSTIKNDLSALLKTKVEAEYFDFRYSPENYDFNEHLILEQESDFSLSFTDYNENPFLLDDSGSSGKIKWGSHLLRSNCKITHQPDWGSIYFEMEGTRLPTKAGFLKYIVSLRNENHFHEEICEMVYKRIIDCFNPDRLVITCMYTRRGGIDINPVRSMLKSDIPKNLTDTKTLSKLMFRQ